MARVSVLIPCRQHGHLLDDALASALGQTWPDVEVVVVNDGSTDDTARVARRWQQGYPDRVIVLETSGIGQARARQLASERARGECWITLDADDRLEPTMVESCLRVLEGAPDAAAATADVWMTDGDGQRALHLLKQRSWPGWPEVLETCPIGAWNGVLIRAVAARWVGGIGVEGASGAEDWDFAVRVVRAGMRVVSVGKALARYRQCGDSHSRDPVPVFRAKLAMLDRCRTEDPRLQKTGVVQPVLDEPAYWRYRNRCLFFAWGVCAASRPTAAAELGPFFGGKEPEWDAWAAVYANGVAHGCRGRASPPRGVPAEVRAAVLAAIKRSDGSDKSDPSDKSDFIRKMARAVWVRHFHGPRYWWRKVEAWRATRAFRKTDALWRRPATLEP